MDQGKIGSKAVFGIKGFDRKCIVGRMDFVESILRRGAEGIADVMADCVCEHNMDIRLSEARPEISWHWEQVTPGIPGAKRHFLELLFLLVMSREIALADAWDEVSTYVQRLNMTNSEVFYNLLAGVWENLNRENYWEIDEEFIYNLDSDYFSLMAAKYLGGK